MSKEILIRKAVEYLEHEGYKKIIVNYSTVIQGKKVRIDVVAYKNGKRVAVLCYTQLQLKNILKKVETLKKHFDKVYIFLPDNIKNFHIHDDKIVIVRINTSDQIPILVDKQTYEAMLYLCSKLNITIAELLRILFVEKEKSKRYDEIYKILCRER